MSETPSMLQLRQTPRASDRPARTLKLLTLKEIRACYLKGDALIKDGWPVGYHIEKLRRSLQFEQLTYETSEKTATNCCDYECYTKEIKLLIAEAEAEVVALIVAHAECGRLILVGRTDPDAAEEIIATRCWAFLDLDIANGVACGLRKGFAKTYRGVRGIFRHNIPTGSSILERIRIAEGRPQVISTPTPGAVGCRIDPPSVPVPIPDQKCKGEAECPSLGQEIEKPASTKKAKPKGSVRLNLHIEDWKSRVRGRQEKGQPEPKNASEARRLALSFVKKKLPGKPLSPKRLGNWLGSPEAKDMLQQLTTMPE